MAIIFFGIPHESIVFKNINKWIHTAGIPDIFCEYEENLKRYKTKLLGKYDVVTIDDALLLYPDAEVWVTYPKADNTSKMLATKLSPHKIFFLEADLEYRKGCGSLGNFFLYKENSFSPCSVRQPTALTSGTIRQRVAQWHDYTIKLIDDINNGRPTKCDECHLLRYGFYRKSIKLEQFLLSQELKYDACNFKCIYCAASKRLERIKGVTEGYTSYDVLQQLSEIPELDTEELTIRLANGEFTVNRYFNEMADVISKTKWKILLQSNMSVYREKLAELMENHRLTKTMVSLDAGTSETFKKIKQRDMFNKVLGNLSKYPVNKANLNLKYIFLEGLNDNETDIDGFCEIAKKFGAQIMLSSNRRAPYTEKMKELTMRLIKNVKADGIKVYAETNFTNPQDAKFINSRFAANRL